MSDSKRAVEVPPDVEQVYNPLPRELVPGLWWLGNCKGGRQVYEGHVLHTYNSVYLTVGEEASAIIECGAPAAFIYVEEQVEHLLQQGIPPVKYIFPTHQEVPHAGGLGRFLQRFPDATARGHVAEYHLVFPEYADRLVEMRIGETVDLGGTEIEVLEAPFRDYIYTRWFLDTTKKALFSGDGFSYSHFHGTDHCGFVAEEAPDLAMPEMTAVYSEKAFWWTQNVDIEPYVERLEWLLEATDAETLCPTHGLPILDIPRTLPDLIKGLRLMPDDAEGRPTFETRVPVLGI